MKFAEIDANMNDANKVLTNFVTGIVKRKVQLVSLKEVYMTLLLSLNEDFDEDLLQDTIGMLTDL
jgi:hypothetical protein